MAVAKIRLLAFVSVAMLVVRVGWVFRFREIDSDAYGHFFIAIATRRDPTNLAVHWVWLPLYHFVVGALTTIGLSFRGLRLANAALATLGPLLLHAAVRRRHGAAKSVSPWAEDPALLAAVALAIAPLTTVLGQSAQPETLFSLLLVASFHEAALDRPLCAGIALAIACFVRYEAWGAAVALVAWWSLAQVRARRDPAARRKPPPFLHVAIPATIVAAYVGFRWWTDGRPLEFLRGTRDITAVQVARHAWTFRELVSFPIVLPFVIFGPAIALVPVGLRRAFPAARDWIVPAGCGGFLLLSYYGGASHSGERYLVSLVPFGCVAIGFGAVRLGRRLGRPGLVAIVTLALLSATTAWHLRRNATMAIAWEPALHERELELARLAR
jgi:hypothetical protein